jgi:hypothetical protein
METQVLNQGGDERYYLPMWSDQDFSESTNGPLIQGNSSTVNQYEEFNSYSVTNEDGPGNTGCPQFQGTSSNQSIRISGEKITR